MAAPSSYEALLPSTPLGEHPVFIGPPAEATPLPQLIAALRTIPPLDGLTEAEYTWLATHGSESVGEDGAIVFLEGSPVDKLHFILMGEIHVRRRNSGSTTLWIGRAGQMTGKLPFSRMKNYGGDGYTVGPVWGLNIHEDHFAKMLAAIPSAMSPRSMPCSR